MELEVAVIGGGVAGAELIRVASKGCINFTLIEPKNRIELQALYPEYLGGLARLKEITAPIQPFCNHIGARFVNEKALYLENKTVQCERSHVDFDIAVIATGAAQNYYGIQGAEITFSINTLDETIKAKRFIEDENPERIMIIGSGLTGVEVACILAESLDVSVYVIEARDRVLPQFSRRTSTLVENVLTKKGVNVLTSIQVKEVKRDCILFFGWCTLGL